MQTVIDIDASEKHDTIIFFVDRQTGYTVAAEKATGRVIGCSAPRGWQYNAEWPIDYGEWPLDALWNAVRCYELTMMEGKTCDEYYRQK